MANGIYSAAAGMAAQQAKLDAISNDLANTSTIGYKSQRVAFRDLVYGLQDGVSVGSGSAAVSVGPSFTAGSMVDSEDPLSVAIYGPGFFQVRRADGTTALTRAGDFQLDAAGSLVTQMGEQLVPPIKFKPGTQPSDVTIAGDGTITVAGAQVGAIKLVQVQAPNALQPVGASLFAATQASGQPTAATGSTLHQGQLEAANVDVATSMMNLLDSQQTYTLSSRALQIQDQLMQIANEIKR